MKTDVTDIPNHTAQQGPDNQPARPEEILPRMPMRRLSSHTAELANHYGRRPYPDNLQPQIRTPAIALVRSESAIWWSKGWQSPFTLLTICDSKSRMSDKDASRSANARGGQRNQR